MLTEEQILKISYEVNKDTGSHRSYLEFIKAFGKAIAEAEGEVIASWYAKEGYLLDEDDVPDAIRERLKKC